MHAGDDEVFISGGNRHRDGRLTSRACEVGLALNYGVGFRVDFDVGLAVRAGGDHGD